MLMLRMSEPSEPWPEPGGEVQAASNTSTWGNLTRTPKCGELSTRTSEARNLRLRPCLRRVARQLLSASTGTFVVESTR
jgi:hypothetical protein